jgi:diguanylate cyclase (GGDEF)-like protein
MKARLEAFGYDVELAENGKDAVDKFSKLCPELVLMDIEMPVMNGFEATNQIRAMESHQQWAWTPIIFLTASDTPESLITAIEAGGDDFLAKKIPEPVLHAKMRAMTRIAELRRQLSSANRKLEEQANLDGLTGLANRRSMDLRFDLAWSEAIRQKQSFGLLMLDVDHFKKFNDHYGHLEGDDCLRKVARAISTVVADFNVQGKTGDGFAARYGGEEFAVTLPDTNEKALHETAAAILESVKAMEIPHERNEHSVVTVSIGGAYVGEASGPIKHAFRTADHHLYQAKSNGRNQAVIGRPPDTA